MGIIKDSLSAHNGVHRRQANTDDLFQQAESNPLGRNGHLGKPDSVLC